MQRIRSLSSVPAGRLRNRRRLQYSNSIMAKVSRTQQQSVPLADPTALARFGRLEVIARLVVEGFMIGQHKSPFKGSSIEFVEHRQYYPGDEIRHIDWRAYGKTGKYYIKEFEDETNLRCYLIVDASGSMRFSESTLSKYAYARQLAAALGYLLLQQRDAVGLVTYDTYIRDRFDPTTSPQSFRKLVDMLAARRPGGETSLSRIFEKLHATIKRRSLIVIMSDCFDQIDRLARALKQFRHDRHELILFQIVAPEEEDFPYTRPTQFRDMERIGQRMLVDPSRLRSVYLEQYRAFEQELARHCGNLGVDFHKLVTNEPYDKALGAYLNSRVHRFRKS